MGELPDAHEIHELQEHSHDQRSRKTGLLISVIAILLAICGALGRKAENFVIVARVDASNTWSYFQAKKLRGYQSETTRELAQLIAAGVAGSREPARELGEKFEAKQKKYEEESEKIAQEAEAHTKDAEKWEARANRFGLGEIFLQIAVVLCSIAILTEVFSFVFGGLAFAAIGIAFAISVLTIV